MLNGYLYQVFVDDEMLAFCSLSGVCDVLGELLLGSSVENYLAWRNQADVVNSFNTWNAGESSTEWVHNNVRVKRM